MTPAIATLVVTLVFGTLTAPLPAEAQPPPKIPRLGIIRISSRADPLDDLLRQAWRHVGFIEGQTIATEWRFADGKTERLPELAAELVQLEPTVIVVFGDLAIRAVQQATRTIPIVAATDDMVGEGHVASFARPGGNITGWSILASELNVKRLELLKATAPKARRIAALWDPATGTFHLKAMEAAARSLRVDLKILEIRGPDDIAGAFEAARKWRAAALNVLASPLINTHRETIINFAAKERLPAIYQWKEAAEVGGLMSYGPGVSAVYRGLAVLVDKILKGAKPADLPVEQPTRFELVINLKTAKTLGLKIPQSVLFRADQVIQ